MKNTISILLLIMFFVIPNYNVNENKNITNDEMIYILAKTPWEKNMIEFKVYENLTADIIFGYDDGNFNDEEIKYITSSLKVNLTEKEFTDIQKNINLMLQNTPAEKYPHAKDACYIKAIVNGATYKYQYGVETIPEPTTNIIDIIIESSDLPEEQFSILNGI